MFADVELCAVDEEGLEQLLRVAVTHAEPEDTMPPVPGPPGWTDERRAAFCEHHRARWAGLDGPGGEATYAVRAGDQVVGAARLARRAAPESTTLEAGVWVADSLRGRGLGTAVLSALIDAAADAGATRIVAETTTANAGAVGILRACGAVLSPPGPDGAIHAELTV